MGTAPQAETGRSQVHKASLAGAAGEESQRLVEIPAVARVSGAPLLHEDPQPASELTFDRILAFVQDLKAQEQHDYTSASELAKTFSKALSSCSVVSFDIFDTALLRYVDHPIDVFLHLEAHPAFAGFRFGKAVSRLRIAAEQTARVMVHKLIASSEVNLLEVFQVFCDQNGISRDQAPAMVAAEEQIELRLCVPCAPLKRLYEQARSAGKRVIFVSDTFHDKDFLLRLLAASGYHADELFVSSELRKSKHEGELFPLVLKALGVAPEALLHLGDNPKADYRQPRKLGVRCILHEHKAAREKACVFIQDGGPLQPGEDSLRSHQSVLRGMVHLAPQRAAAEGQEQDFWWKFGYSSAGPLTVGFCQWLEQSLRSGGIDHAYFLLRDGALLHRVYQALYQNAPGACPATAIASSRRAALLPTLELSPSFVIHAMTGGVGKRPLREFLERFHVKADGFLGEARKAGFETLEDQIDGRFDSNRLIRFFCQKSVLTSLLDRGRIERAPLMQFLRQERFTEHRRVAVVDLGWAGTIQKCLHLLLAAEAPKTHLTGYYMATYPEEPWSVLPGLNVRSYLAHRGEPVEVYRRILQFLRLFDDVYSSNEGSLLYFTPATQPTGAAQAPGPAAAAPVLQPCDKSAAECRQLDTIHQGALAFAADFRTCAAMQPFPPLPPLLAAEEFFRVFSNPTAEEAVHLSEVANCDNLGSSSRHPAARLRATSDPAQLLEDYRNAHWKDGLLARPTSEASALRTMIWLMVMHGVEDALLTPEERGLTG